MERLAKAKTRVQEYKVLFRPWLFYGYVDIPEMEGYKPTKITAETHDGRNGVKIHYLKLE